MEDAKNKKKFNFFWGGNFSQWAKYKFVIDGVEYCCAEQYMMLKKALMFHDYISASKIMKTKNPKEQKKFGREVKNFNKNKWETYCRDIVYDANVAKFTQNRYLLDELISTGNKEIVESSPYDKIWGIGLSDDNPFAWNKSTWQGKNWLGIEIERVRNDIKTGKLNHLIKDYERKN